MDIIRSKLNVQGPAKDNWFDYIIDIFEHEKVLSTWKKYEIDDSDTDNKIATFYINDDIYIKMTCTPSNFSIELYSYGYTNTIYGGSSSSGYINCITIYKQNTCTGFNFKISSYVDGSYSSLEIPIVIDSINNDPNNIVVLYTGNKRFYTSVTDNYVSSYWYYGDSGSGSLYTNSIQLVPFVISKINAQFDTLYGVCFSPVMNKFVMFNDERWLITGSGIAIPCGDEINYYYVD